MFAGSAGSRGQIKYHIQYVGRERIAQELILFMQIVSLMSVDALMAC